MKKIIQMVWILAILLLSSASGQSCGPDDQQFLITFHPHLDAFWLNIDNQLKDINFKPAGFLYAMNQRNSKTIFNSMLQALNGNQTRKYFVTEAVFFKDWYDYLSSQAKTKTKKILQNGQLQIANGGWVQNDEAVCYYDDILDQYTLGMNFLYQNFNHQVKIGWATDSFGHSHSQAALQHLLGIQFQGIQRVDDRYVNQHNQGPLLQFYWDAISDSNNLTYGGVLNHVRHFLHEVNNFRGGRQQAIKQDFVQLEKVLLKVYNKNKIFRFLGNDFEEFVTEEFQALQKVMDQVNNQRGKTSCKAFKYGNPSDYLNLISKYYDQNELKVRKYDFIPNWDQDRYWTGYYTTDPMLKKACKDFSRLINFYRKYLLQLDEVSRNIGKLVEAEELLAVMQHHDGITATSKTYIETEFINRMKTQSQRLVKSIQQLTGASNGKPILCKFYQNQNQCQIMQVDTAGPQLKQLNIITHGGSKTQKIQIFLPQGIYYNILEVEDDLFCEESGGCVIVFEASLHAGVNTFHLEAKTKEQMADSITMMEQATDLSHSGRDFRVNVESSRTQIKYQYGDGEFFSIGLYRSPNNYSNRQTVWWNKFGRRTDKTQGVAAGMYIMSNNGQISPVSNQFTSLKVGEGKIYKRFVANSVTSTLQLTVQNDQPNILDIIHKFNPNQRTTQDFFMKVSSTVKSSTLYHDANGFLVAKRLYNKRPDYRFEPKPEDRINGNTYPVCSFAYLINDDKKMVFFTDRAQGVAAYDQDLLINFDRLAMDDGKGVGQNYMKVVPNTFRYKFAIVSVKDDIQRRWQKDYDQMLIGYVTKGQASLNYRKDSSAQISHIPGLGPRTRIKYSIFLLNNDQYVLRLQNLGQFTTISVNKYKQTTDGFTWKIDQIGLNIKFVDIVDSYANGIPVQTKQTWRRHWSKNKIQINIKSQTGGKQEPLTLRPLQIRSFRINTKTKIQIKKMASKGQQQAMLGHLSGVSEVKTSYFRKRCF